MATQLKKEMVKGPLKIVMCGFGVGLSWGAIYMETDSLKYLDCIEI